MSEIYPILICSKGRAKACPTIKKLIEQKLPFTVFVEKEDEAQYAPVVAGHGKLIVLPESGKGLAYSRNAALKYAIAQDYEWYWMIDDDIAAWYEIIEKKPKTLTIKQALEKAQALFPKRPDLAMISLQMQVYAWSKGWERPVVLYAHADDVICINAKKLRRLSYHEELPLKIDRDFALQALSNGWVVARIDRICFREPNIGSNKGGLYDVYADGQKEKHACDLMMKRWGTTICEPVMKERGIDLVIRYREFDPSRRKA